MVSGYDAGVVALSVERKVPGVSDENRWGGDRSARDNKNIVGRARLVVDSRHAPKAIASDKTVLCEKSCVRVCSARDFEALGFPLSK